MQKNKRYAYTLRISIYPYQMSLRARDAEPAEILDLQEQEHEHCGREDQRADEHVHDPLQPQVRRHVRVVHRVVAVRVQVRVRGRRRQRTHHVHRPVARVHAAARERNQRLVHVAFARNLERVVPPRRARVIPLRVCRADPAAYERTGSYFTALKECTAPVTQR